MKGKTLTVKEKEKYRMIRKVITGKISMERCSVILGLSKRRVGQLIKISEQEGISGFSHKSKGVVPHNKSDKALIEQIIQLYSAKYAGFNYKHFKEKTEQMVESRKVAAIYWGGDST